MSAYAYSNSHLGDAVGETKNWYYDLSEFPCTSRYTGDYCESWFIRNGQGGNYDGGIYNYYGVVGEPWSLASFRIVITAEDNSN